MDQGELSLWGAEAQALPSDQRELLVGFVAGATRVWQMPLALSLTIIMSVGMESIKLKRAEAFMVTVDAGDGFMIGSSDDRNHSSFRLYSPSRGFRGRFHTITRLFAAKCVCMKGGDATCSIIGGRYGSARLKIGTLESA
jgi:hypothetical protein